MVFSAQSNTTFFFDSVQSVQGTGLAFIAFTEAMTHFPASPFWSVMFFLMLINLGLGSMIGTMAGITTPIIDTFKVRKEALTGKLPEGTPLTVLYSSIAVQAVTGKDWCFKDDVSGGISIQQVTAIV